MSFKEQDRIELRVTRPGLYPRDCQNPEFMEGHYFRGLDFNDAKAKAEAKFPHEKLHITVFKTLIDGEWVRADVHAAYNMSVPRTQCR